MNISSDKREVGGWWMWFLLLIAISGVALFMLNSMGLVGKTIIERKVFENSFQYSEARKSEIALFEAQLAEIDRKLMSRDLDENTRVNLEAQAASVRIHLSVARSKQ